MCSQVGCVIFTTLLAAALLLLLANVSSVGSGEEEVGPEQHRQSSHVSHDPPMYNSPDANLGRVVAPCEFVLCKDPLRPIVIIYYHPRTALAYVVPRNSHVHVLLLVWNENGPVNLRLQAWSFLVSPTQLNQSLHHFSCLHSTLYFGSRPVMILASTATRTDRPCACYNQ